MSRGNPELLAQAAARKRQAARDRADAGIRALLKVGAPITFEAVAAAGNVSKDFLYRTTDLRDRIQDLRKRTTGKPGVAPLGEPAAATTTSSVVRTLTITLREERSRHRAEISELKTALEAAHGELLRLRRLHGDSGQDDAPNNFSKRLPSGQRVSPGGQGEDDRRDGGTRG
ncbi:hypothetical protein [Arthrobacter sp. NicSoilB8]|uniref:hypothetical protein n=1 Tax=Arthrobacter sp. NicSoilB8 TaxID=2830998 RepID=UPI001CC3C882|nr:hypothetical protein [Arthrobacter sp. NicSoilB8]BCW73636.1 hypothetical protein NicSoilB8_46800 [Arthrobacter sp. NicSoilB8]